REAQKGAEECCWYACGNPEGEPEFQKQCQDTEDEQQPEEAVLEKEFEPLHVDFGVVVLEREFDRWRQCSDNVGQGRANRVRHADWRLVTDAVNRDPDRPLAVEARQSVAVGKAFRDIRHVTKSDEGPAGAGYQRDLGEFPSPVAALLDPEEDLSGLGPYRAAAAVECCLADCRGDGIQCQPVRAETLLRDFDVNFEIPRTFKLDLGDPGFRQQPVARNFRGLTECPLVDVSEELQVKHAPAPGIERDPGPLRIVRKGRDTADGLLNVLEDPVVVAARLEFGNDPAGALVCSGADLDR